MICGKDGKARNGNLRYTIRPVQEAVNRYAERQMETDELVQMRVKAAEKVGKQTNVERC